MPLPGTTGKILMVDLDRHEMSVETPNDEIYYRYLGGYGLGAYYVYRLQRPRVDPLGPDNHLGFFTGLLTGTPGITSNRYVVVGKSPKTSTWGDANSGGTFGPTIKAAGYDGVLLRGVSQEPVYLLLSHGEARLLSATQWWGWDCEQVEDRVQELYGPKARSASIGPPGERMNLLSCVINDRGRAAGRSGLGAVMGSKRLKAVVAVGEEKVAIADRQGLDEVLEKHRQFLQRRESYRFFHQYGTSGMTAAACASGDAPIKNWGGVPEDFPTAGRISDDAVLARQKRKWACWRCPIGCGGQTIVTSGPYASRSHKPEYETLGAFGALCLNDNLESINLCNQICNRYGLDTIGTGGTVAFAIECYEKGIITAQDTGGVELGWGDHQAIVEITRQIAEGRGFGRVLADGVRQAAERIGNGAQQYAIHIQGEEVPMHDPRLNPGLATSYQMDATPARHTQMSAWTAEAQFAPPGLVPDNVERHNPQGKGRLHALVSNHFHVAGCAGMCMFAWSNLKPEALSDSLTAITGRPYTLDEIQQMGTRIAALRIAFNLREGLRNVDFRMPGRIIGVPPLESGPLEGMTVDVDTQVRDYLEAMGWNLETGVPSAETLRQLGLDFVAADLHP
jgi:aldehyde:ferredoxin oxidoreductase